jgi:hypothetical protein
MNRQALAIMASGMVSGVGLIAVASIISKKHALWILAVNG